MFLFVFMKYIFCTSLLFLVFLVASDVGGQTRGIEIKGKVIARIVSNVELPTHGHVPRSDILIVKLIQHKNGKPQFVTLINEYFSEKSTLPATIFDPNGSWKFRVTRRADCDRTLPSNPRREDHASRATALANGEVFEMDQPEPIEFIGLNRLEDLPKGQALPCYAILSAKEE